MKKSERLSFRLDDTTATELRVVSKATGVSVGTLLRMAVIDYVSTIRREGKISIAYDAPRFGSSAADAVSDTKAQARRDDIGESLGLKRVARPAEKKRHVAGG
jgi:hypothetical protein